MTHPSYLARIPSLMGLAAVTLVLAACGGGKGAEPDIDARTRLDFGACLVALPDPGAVCGTLTVAENRERASSRLIQVPFAILPARANDREKEPIVVFGGGPGPSTLNFLAQAPAELLAQHPLRQHRDMIVMDLRGSALTRPQSLDCPELVRDPSAGERFESVDAVLEAAAACKAGFKRDGADLSAYNSRSAARDPEELRILLGRKRGFAQWNVVGTSYGSRRALYHLRESGAVGIRSLVLDGPLPPQVGTIRETGVLDALSEVVSACGRNGRCAPAFPELVLRFARSHRAAGAQPRHAPRRQPALRPSGGAAARRRAERRGILGGAAVHGPRRPRRPPGCGRDLSARRRARVAGRSRRRLLLRALPRRGRPAGAGVRTLDRPGQTLPPRPVEPVRSAVPALVTVGSFDAATPLSNVGSLQRDLPRSRLVVFPGRGHGLLESDPCMLQIAADFIERPHAAPDTACVPDARSLGFLMP